MHWYQQYKKIKRKVKKTKGDKQLDREDKYREYIGDQNSTYSKVERGLAREMINENQ